MALRLILGAIFVLSLAACSHEKDTASIPLIKVKDQEPDAMIFDRAMHRFEQKDYVVALSLLQTLLTIYPESRYSDQAKIVLKACERREDCGYLWKQIEALPPGGGMIFFRPLATDETQQKKLHQR